MPGERFVHLHVHTEYSMLDGAARVRPLLDEVERLGMPAVAITDHGNVHGAFEFYQQASARGIKPVIGMEAYLAPTSRHHKQPVWWGEAAQRDDDVAGGGAYTHLTLLAQDARGLRNLFRLSSLASLEGHYYKPRLDRELLASHGAGLIATTGCPSGEVQTRLRLGQYQQALRAAADFRDIFGAENFYLELMDHGLAIERRVRADLLRIAYDLRLAPLATNDAHYVHRRDAKVHATLLCVRSGATLADPNRFTFASDGDGDGYYLTSASDMRRRWDGEVPDACDTTLAIAQRVGAYAEVFAQRDLMPTFPVPAGHTPRSWLDHEVWAGMRRRYPNGVDDDRRRRVEYETGVIATRGLSSYFLVVADLVRYAKDNGIRVGPGRGSATGCLVGYALGITDLDPVRHGLLFERFLNPERAQLPDIDLDFDERRRGEVIEYIRQRWGEDRVAQIVTFTTIKARAAIKDAARVLAFPFAVGERLTKAMPPAVAGRDVALSAIIDPEHPRYDEAGEVRELIASDTDAAKVFAAARDLEGSVRQAGVHAAGVILSTAPLLDVVPVSRREADGAVITQWDSSACESIGLLKMDVLGLRNLTVVEDAIANIQANLGVAVDLDTLPFDDPKTYALLASGATLGVFQLDGGPMRSLLKSLAPATFNDLAAVLALYRPGPIAANAHVDYADRRNGRAPVVPIHPELAGPLADILDETYGLIVYQEQVMAIAARVAGYSLGAADLLRRAMTKKDDHVLRAEFRNFHAGMRANGYSDEAIQALWDVLVPFARYAFTKSHAAGYGVISYWTGYLKANYPVEYLAALLTSVRGDKDKMAVYLAECRRMGIDILPPDVNESSHDFTPSGTSIRFGLRAVRDVGPNVVRSVVDTRGTKGRYRGFVDFLMKSDAIVRKKRTVDSLIKAGAFDSLGHTRRGLAQRHEEVVDAVIGLTRHEATGQYDLFGDGTGDDVAAPVGLDMRFSTKEWPPTVLLGFEREVLGRYVSWHLLADTATLLPDRADHTIAALAGNECADGSIVAIAGIISALRHGRTSAGAEYAVATVADRDSSVEVMFFRSAYEAFGARLRDDAIVAIKGRLDRKGDTPRLVAMELNVAEVTDA